jgi:hypothetical protein
LGCGDTLPGGCAKRAPSGARLRSAVATEQASHLTYLFFNSAPLCLETL